ncbi:hypothetical protein [Erythrobacter sp.]|jgi:hypothetical protein|uniref:hypothetical protein n=1 Tax=Erythrobacter sp. TaxID=1042 RepID=UPI002EA441E2|nr:hypothetical protein [Erythrobacter sp.]
MILSALLLSVQPAPEPIPEIVVLGNLRSVTVSVGQDREGSWHCSLSKSTGRAKLDDRFCRAVTECVRDGASNQAEVDTCIREERGRLVRRFERATKRGSQ